MSAVTGPSVATRCKFVPATYRYASVAVVNEYASKVPPVNSNEALEPPACSLIPARCTVNRSPVPRPAATPEFKASWRRIVKLDTDTEPKSPSVNDETPPETWNVCADTLLGPPANAQFVAVDGL